MKKLIRFSLIVLIVGFIIQCNFKKKQAEKEEVIVEPNPTVFVSNYPLEYFVNRIAGNSVDVVSAYKDLDDPTSWDPGEEDINLLLSADLIFLNGASFEPWAMTMSLPKSRLVVTTAAIEDKLIAEKQTVSHSHGPEGEHEHTISAYTTWLNLKLANAQAKAVMEALSKLQPKSRPAYEANFNTLSEQLLALDDKMRTTTQSWLDTRVIYSRPVFQYLQEAYGIKGSSLQWAADSIPDKKQWHDFGHEQGHHPSKFMIWDSGPVNETKDKLTSRGVETIVFDPCIFPPNEGDFISAMEDNIQNLKNANPDI